MVPPAAWADLAFFQDDWPGLRDRLAGDAWLPGRARVFAALDAVAPGDVRVLILGQDPYPNAAHAMGLAFSVPEGTAPLPASLRNILRELADDIGATRVSGDLTGWARQGVLLLNTRLSVPEGVSNGHAGWGWERLAAQVVARVARRPVAAVLWGADAARFATPHLRDPAHLVLRAPHPSPLSAHRGFFGSRPFSAVNGWLVARGGAAIDWTA